MPNSLKVLAIETSCDETSLALLDCKNDDITVLQNLVSSQIPVHQKYGGVVPEVAARTHVAEIVGLLSQILNAPSNSPSPPLNLRGGWGELFDAVVVTKGPGLATALRVGLETAKTLAYLSGKPIVGVNHLEGHIGSAWLNTENRRRWKFPVLALVVSGGHTELVLMKDFGKYKIVGQTRDDAAGEAFDKSAKLMGLPYPGGPQIAKLAEGGDATAFDLPRPMLKDPSLDFSFSGLKTAVRQVLEKAKIQKLEKNFAASLQQAIVDVLIEKTIRGAKKYKAKGIALVGGVSANAELRRQLGEHIAAEIPSVAFLPSDRSYVTDNAAMIGVAGYWNLRRGKKDHWKKLDVDPELNF